MIRPRRFIVDSLLIAFVALVSASLLSACTVYHYPDEGVSHPPPSQEDGRRPTGRPDQPNEPPPPPPPRAEPPPQTEPPPAHVPIRPAPPPPPGRLTAGLIPAKSVFLPGESIPVRVVLTNTGPSAAVVYEIRRAFMEFAVVDERGTVTSCHREDADLPRRIEAGRFLRLQPGASIDHSVHLDRFCGELEPGTWQVRLTYTVPPAFDGRAFGLRAATGSFEATSSIRVEAPAPRANLVLHISRTRRTRADEPFEVTTRLTNRGPDAALVLPPDAGPLSFVVRDSRGREIDCSLPSPRMPRRSDFVSLARGRHLESTIDLSRHCDLREGNYEILAVYRIDPAMVRNLTPADTGRLIHDEIVSNRLPFEREAARPRATVRLEAGLPVDTVRGQGAIPVLLRAVNEGPDQVVLAVPGVHIVTARVEKDGVSVGCRVASRSPRAPSATNPTRRVRPGAAATGQIDLRALCDIEQPGSYLVTFTYTVPEEGAARNAWSGTATSAPVRLTVERERRATPTPRPSPPPAPVPVPAPEPSRPDRGPRGERDLDLFVTGPERIRAGESLLVTVELHSGSDELNIGRLDDWMITWSVQDRYGRRFSCDTPAAPSRLPAASDFMTIAGRQHVSRSFDLAEICGLDDPGRYFVSAQLHIPRSWSGRRHGIDAWTGTLVSSPLTVEVREARERGRGRGR